MPLKVRHVWSQPKLTLKRCANWYHAWQRAHHVSSNLSRDPQMPNSGFFAGDGLAIDRLGQALPYGFLDDRDHLMTLVDTTTQQPNALGFTLELTPQTGVTQEMVNALKALTDVGLPPKSTLSMTVYASPFIDGALQAWGQTRQRALHEKPVEVAELIRKCTHARIEQFQRASYEAHALKGIGLTRHFRLWLHIVYPTDTPEDPASRAHLVDIQKAIQSVLEQAGLFGHFWGQDDFTQTTQALLNPQLTHARHWIPQGASPFEALRFQLMNRQTQIHVTQNGLHFMGSNESYLASPTPAHVMGIGLSIENYSPEINLGQFSLLLGEPGRAGGQIDCPFLLTTSLEVPHQVNEKMRIGAQRIRAKQMMNTPLGYITPYYAEKYHELDVAYESFATDGGVARVRHQLFLYVAPNEAYQMIQSAQALGRKAGLDLEVDAALHAQSLLASLPMGLTPGLTSDLIQMGQFPRRTWRVALNSLPLMTESTGTGRRADETTVTPLLLLLGRKGQVSFLDNYACAHGGYSATVVGKPGAGKSVVMNEWALSVFSMGGRVWIIDVGRSYEKLTKLLHGQFIEFSPTDHWDLNPLRLVDTHNDRDAKDRLEMVTKIMEALMSHTALDDYAHAILSQAITEVVHLAQTHQREATVDDLYDVLQSYHLPDDQPEHRALELAAMLQPYTATGLYGAWFNGQGKPIDFDNPMTVLELEGLSGSTQLRNGVLMTLMLMIEESMHAMDRKAPKLVMIDEAWDLMGQGSAGSFIEMGYRRARKLNGAFVTATQSIADYQKSETAQAAWRCAETRIFLRQDPESLEALGPDSANAELPWLKAAIASLTTVAGAYSEMVVKVGDQAPAIVRLVLDPVSRVLYSTLPAEWSAVKAYQAQGKTLSEAIEAVALEGVTVANHDISKEAHHA